MNRVVHFEFAAVEPARAAEFYRQVFGWGITSWPGQEGDFLVTTGPIDHTRTTGRLIRHQDAQPRTVNAIEVDSLDDYAAKVKQHGGTVVVEKQVIPGGGYQIYCKDTEGNLFGVHQADPNAQP